MLLAGTSAMHAQMDASIKLNEVMTNNRASLQDEYGQREACRSSSSAPLNL